MKPEKLAICNSNEMNYLRFVPYTDEMERAFLSHDWHPHSQDPKKSLDNGGQCKCGCSYYFTRDDHHRGTDDSLKLGFVPKDAGGGVHTAIPTYCDKQ